MQSACCWVAGRLGPGPLLRPTAGTYIMGATMSTGEGVPLGYLGPGPAEWGESPGPLSFGASLDWGGRLQVSTVRQGQHIVQNHL